jgi:hypothetical protein
MRLTKLIGYSAVVHKREGFRYALNIHRDSSGAAKKVTVAPISKGHVKLRRADGGSEWVPLNLVFGEISPTKKGPKRIRRALGFPGYFVSDGGTAFSTRGSLVYVLIPGETGGKGPYLSVRLYDGKGHKRTVRVHRLVWSAFNGPIPPGLDVRHLNHQPHDNRLENLAVGTRAENIHDSVVAGRLAQKLTTKAVKVIRDLVGRGMTQTEAAKIFEVHWTVVSKIVRREIWKHVA